LNDNLVDIGLFQQLAANRVEPRPAERAGREALDMGAVDLQHPPDPNHAPDQFQVVGTVMVTIITG
jgi:hypothetical protein